MASAVSVCVAWPGNGAYREGVRRGYNRPSWEMTFFILTFDLLLLPLSFIFLGEGLKPPTSPRCMNPPLTCRGPLRQLAANDWILVTFTIVPLVVGTLHFGTNSTPWAWGAQSPAANMAPETVQTHKSSNHCSTRYLLTPGSRECAYRWNALHNDTAPRCGGSGDQYPKPLDPK